MNSLIRALRPLPTGRWGLRDYGVPGQLGLEKTPEEYVAKMVEVFHEVKRVSKPQATLWLNLGDSYVADSYQREKGTQAFQDGDTTKSEGWLVEDRKNSGRHRKNLSWASDCGLKRKDLVGIPWRVAFALQADGWYLRSDIIWSKPNPMPESVRDRPTKAHEYIFLFSKSQRYYFDQDAVREPINPKCDGTIRARARTADGALGGANQHHMEERIYDTIKGPNIRSVWTIATQPYSEAHFATFPEQIPERCIKAGCPEGGVVLDPFIGSGTVAKVAIRLRRNWIGIDLNPAYSNLAEKRKAWTQVEMI